MGFFGHVPLASPDPILGLTAAFNADKRTMKVNLSVGLYRTADLKTPIMGCVKKAEAELLELEKSKEYLPIDGEKNYLELVGKLVFGDFFWSQSSKRICAVQTVGGTSALRIGGEFLKQEGIAQAIYLSSPTWPNHRGVFLKCGMQVENYPYYNLKKHELDFDELYAFLSKLSQHSIIMMHASCHNPTGADLTLDQWKKLSALFLSKKLIPFFDLAYQGIDQGLEEDAKAIRLFGQEGHEMLIACSFSKNFSLYSERVGALLVVGESHKVAEHVLSKIKTIVRTNYSNPPKHGAYVVAHILGSQKLKAEWEVELTVMRERIIEMRKAFVDALVAKSRDVDFSFLKNRSGMFSFCGLSEQQVKHLIEEYGIYMTSDGRINIAGLNWDNLDYVVSSLISVAK
jgi:aspartate aminotransferase